MDTKNLLNETLEILQNHGIVPADVRWVQVNVGDWIAPDLVSCSWDEFVQHADIVYNSSYGSAEISQSLKVVGDDWWLEREEYDGSEWWEFKTLPIQPRRAELRASDILEK